MNKPAISSLKAKLGVLERRRDYLEKKIQGDGEQSYNLAEISALNAALTVLQWYAQKRDEGESPIGLLVELVAIGTMDDEVADLQERASKLLKELE
jgi:hypothetical protein